MNNKSQYNYNIHIVVEIYILYDFTSSFATQVKKLKKKKKKDLCHPSSTVYFRHQRFESKIKYTVAFAYICMRAISLKI